MQISGAYEEPSIILLDVQGASLSHSNRVFSFDAKRVKLGVGEADTKLSSKV